MLQAWWETYPVVTMFIMAAVVGLAAGLSPGPLLALVITQTVRYGPREGARVAFAPLITDVPIVLGALVTLDWARRYDIVLDLISLGGGVYVLYLAWETIRASGVSVNFADDTPPHSLRKGILVNALSPHPYLFWFSTGAYMFATAAKAGLFVGVMVIVVFEAGLVGSKIVVANLVGYSRDFLTGKVYINILRALGVLLALFGLRMIVGALQSLW
ncbi:MAG: LysE family translocator [Candidatus Hydrogenedentes bacterium]|nr:LysE family translocator [Candidatus Hydrogenedentota bacterium]